MAASCAVHCFSLSLFSCHNIHIMIRSSRFGILVLFVFAALSFLFLGPYKAQLPNAASIIHEGQEQIRSSGSSQTLLTGHAIAPKLGNATAKYVVYRASGRRTVWLTRREQGRTRSRGLEAHAHDLRSIPRKAHRRRKRSSAPIRPPLPATIPMRRVRRALRPSSEEIPSTSLVAKGCSTVGLLRAQCCKQETEEAGV